MTAGDYARVERAIHFLETRGARQPTLGEVAAHVGLSESHFHRLFHRWAGVTPKDFLQCLTMKRAKALLGESRSILEASLEVGLSGTGRLHDLFVTLEAMTPGEFKRLGAGLQIHWGAHSTPFGDALFAATARGLCALSFLGGTSTMTAVAALQEQWPGARLIEEPSMTAAAAEEVKARMRGTISAPLSLLLRGSAFQIKVWEALLSIPEGSVTSYGLLARGIGEESSSRAVGTAVSRNPIAYLVPCHRVIRGTGVIGEYRWGSLRKQALLGAEGARAAAQRATPEAQ